MKKSEDFPQVPEDLLLALKEAFPDRLPRRLISHEDFLILQGQQKVIDFLSVKFNDQLKGKR